MKRAYLYRLYPTTEQAHGLQQQLDVAREVYNACLLERREAYRLAGLTHNYYTQANQLKDIRRDRPDISGVNFSMLQAICRRTKRAYDTFFRRLREWQDRLGLEPFLMTDRGKPVVHPQPLRAAQARLRRTQRRLARKQRGSHRRQKQRRCVARLHEKIANVRRNFQYQTAHDLVMAFDVICHEDLQVKNMVHNHCLAQLISDAAWSQFIAILVGKAEGAGRQTLAVNPRDTSQTCVCGEPVPKDLGQRWHHCLRCGLSLPRDQVSAMRIKTLGLEIIATKSGLGSSPQAPMWPAGACVA